MPHQHRHPPKLFERVLRAVLPAGIVQEDVMGTLAEDFDDLCASRGERYARRWYRRQALGITVRAFSSGLRGVRTDPSASHLGRDFPYHRTRRFEMSSFILDVKYALRSFRSTPGLVLAALVTLALGVGANTAMFSIVNGVLLAPLGYPNESEVVAIWPEKRHSTAMIEELREATSSFAAIAGMDFAQFTLTGEGEPQVVDGEVVGVQYFDVVGMQPALGRPFLPDDAVRANGPVAILTHDLWTRRFGADSSIVGQTVALSSFSADRYQVVGVLPRDFPNRWVGTQVLVPMITDENADGYNGSYGAGVMARLAPGVPVEVASSEVSRLVPDFATRHATQFREVRHSPVDVVPMHEVAVREVRGRLLLMLGAVGLVLLIACTNVANLLLARGVGQRHEIGLRLALGASGGRIARMVLTESTLLAVVGGVIGTAAAAVSLPLVVSFVSDNLPRTAFIQLDLKVLAFGLTASALSSLVFGLGPALRAARQQPADTMGDATRSGSQGTGRVRINDALVTAEIALSVILVLGAGLMLKSLWRLSDVNPGFDGSHVLTMRLSMASSRYDSTEARRAFFAQATERLEGIPGIEEAAWSNYLPLFGGSAGIPYVIQGREPPEGAPSVVGGYKIGSPEFFDIMQMPLLAGRSFSPEDVDDADLLTVLINQTMARQHWGDGSPLGAVVLSSGSREPFARIVGVVGDIRQSSLAEPPDPEFYFVGGQGGYGFSYLLIRTAIDPRQVVEPARAAIRGLDQDLPILDVQTMDEVVEAGLGSSRFYVVLFGTFAALALALGLVGVYGVMAYAISRRTREIGVRVALGATPRTILVSTIKKGMVSVGIGIAIGLIGAFAVSRLLTSLLYEVRPTDITVYLTVAVTLAAAGVMANVVPALRASRLDPVIALRAD